MSLKASLFLIALVLIPEVALAQVYSIRVVGHTPQYERILLSKGSPLRPQTFRGIDDLKPDEQYVGTNRIDALFADLSKERTNRLHGSCFSEVQTGTNSWHFPGGLLNPEDARQFLGSTVAIPRSIWINQTPSLTNWRYVFSCKDINSQEYVIDLRSGSFAVVFFPDGTYRCLVDPAYKFVQPIPRNATEVASQSGVPPSNQTSSAPQAEVK